MKTFLIILIILLCSRSFSADFNDNDKVYFNKVANAIYKAENSERYPYGIMSINTHGDKVLARKICLNTIQSNWAKWSKTDKHIDFIDFLNKSILK